MALIAQSVCHAQRKEVKINSMNSNTTATATPPPPTPAAAAAAATATAAHTTSLKCSSRSAFACGVSTNTNTSTNSRNNMTTTATATVASLTTAKRYYCFQLHSSHRQLLRKEPGAWTMSSGTPWHLGEPCPAPPILNIVAV